MTYIAIFIVGSYFGVCLVEFQRRVILIQNYLNYPRFWARFWVVNKLHEDLALPYSGGTFNHQYTILTIKQELTNVSLKNKLNFCKHSICKKKNDILPFTPNPHTIYLLLQVFSWKDFILWPVKLYKKVFTFTKRHITCFLLLTLGLKKCWTTEICIN